MKVSGQWFQRCGWRDNTEELTTIGAQGTIDVVAHLFISRTCDLEGVVVLLVTPPFGHLGLVAFLHLPYEADELALAAVTETVLDVELRVVDQRVNLADLGTVCAMAR